MTRTWVPDSGWTGMWTVPASLQQPLTETERAILVSLSCNGVGPKRLASLLASADRIGDLSTEHSARLRVALRNLAKVDARAVVPSDDEYPADLCEIDAAPPLLYVRGVALDVLQPRVAIVGARACTSGAARFAYKLGATFASAGFTVVSGLARGIDGAAHAGALESGRTIAVLGTGIDVCYPAEHRELAARVTGRGALVSEFPPGTGPRAWHFPARNRIISGISSALIVVEAGASSGALITAGFALDQGRHVLACTTGPENPAGKGVRDMLRDGAQLVVDADQAVEIVIDLLNDQRLDAEVPVRVRIPEPGEQLVGDERAVFDAILDAVTIDDIAKTTSFDMRRIASVLTALELEGLAVCDDGRWSRVTRGPRT